MMTQPSRNTTDPHRAWSLDTGRVRPRTTSVAFWALLVLINGIGLWLRFASHDVGPLDMRADFSHEYVQASLETYADSGSIDIYRFFFIPVDFLFILSYVIAGSALARRLQPNVAFLAWLPVGFGIADALENLTVLWMLNHGTSGWSFEALTVFTLVKDAGLVTYLVWLSVVGTQTIVARVSARRVQSP